MEEPLTQTRPGALTRNSSKFLLRPSLPERSSSPASQHVPVSDPTPAPPPIPFPDRRLAHGAWGGQLLPLRVVRLGQLRGPVPRRTTRPTGCGPVVGKLMDDGWPALPLALGTFLHVFGPMIHERVDKLCVHHAEQAVLLAIGSSLAFYPAVTCVKSISVPRKERHG